MVSPFGMFLHQLLVVSTVVDHKGVDKVAPLSFHLAGTLPGCPVFHYCAGLGGDPGPGTDPFPACGQCMSLLFLPSAADSFCTPLSDL